MSISFKKVKNLWRKPDDVNPKRRLSRKERAAYELHGHRCHYCGCGGNLTTDHMVPRSDGGPDESWNLVPACRSCNSAKGSKDYFEFWECVLADRVAFEMHMSVRDFI